MKSLPRGPAGPGEVWPGAYTDAPRPRKGSNRLFQGFRRLRKRQNAPLEISDASEGSKHAAGDFRGLGRGSPAGLKILDRYPANLAGVPDAPRPRKASKHAAEGFRALGKRQNTPLKVSDASEGSKHAAGDFRGLGKGSLCHEKSLIGGVVPMRLLKRDRPPRGGADQRNPVPCLPESRTSFMLAGSTRRRTPLG